MSCKIGACTLFRSGGGACLKPSSTAGRSEISHRATSQINMVLNVKELYGAEGPVLAVCFDCSWPTRCPWFHCTVIILSSRLCCFWHSDQQSYSWICRETFGSGLCCHSGFTYRGTVLRHVCEVERERLYQRGKVSVPLQCCLGFWHVHPGLNHFTAVQLPSFKASPAQCLLHFNPLWSLTACTYTHTHKTMYCLKVLKKNSFLILLRLYRWTFEYQLVLFESDSAY